MFNCFFKHFSCLQIFAFLKSFICRKLHANYIHSQVILRILLLPIIFAFFSLCLMTSYSIIITHSRDPHEFAGPEGLHTSLFCIHFPIISTLMADLFSNSLDTSLISDDWLRVQMTHFFKAGKQALHPATHHPWFDCHVPPRNLTSPWHPDWFTGHFSQTSSRLLIASLSFSMEVNLLSSGSYIKTKHLMCFIPALSVRRWSPWE